MHYQTSLNICGRVAMSSMHLQCNLRLFTFSSEPNLIILTLGRLSVLFKTSNGKCANGKNVAAPRFRSKLFSASRMSPALALIVSRIGSTSNYLVKICRFIFLILLSSLPKMFTNDKNQSNQRGRKN